ncbi:MAG: DUF1593 domain-containing protein, partial [Oscillibacter sp.]|nr:DUF1593 domain-containing protein [Oscillibacter sp.]
MRRRTLAWLLAAVMLMSLLAGCQSGGGQESAEPEQTPETATVSEESGVPNEPEDAPEASGVVTATKQEKARTVITTDGEVDDQDSVIRALLYANDMDIAGIVLTSSMYHYAGDESKGVEPYRWTGTEWISNFLDAYEEVYDNLKAHDPEY